jgi:hypothetical protein
MYTCAHHFLSCGLLAVPENQPWPLAADLLRRMLTFERARASLDQVLQHEFVAWMENGRIDILRMAQDIAEHAESEWERNRDSRNNAMRQFRSRLRDAAVHERDN